MDIVYLIFILCLNENVLYDMIKIINVKVIRYDKLALKLHIHTFL